MATSSIFTNVRPKDKTSIRKLVKALEHSRTFKGKEVQITHSVSDFTPEQIQKIFGDNDERL